jgi:hypothetical protein
VIWNLRHIYDYKSPQYDAPAAPIVRATVSMVDAFEKADDKTVVLTTKYSFSFLPYLLTRVPGQLAVQGRARAPGDQLRRRSGRHVQDAERCGQAGGGTISAGQPDLRPMNEFRQQGFKAAGDIEFDVVE